MEVSFLSSTGNFGGVGYNLSKVMKNAGELLDVINFDGLMHISNVSIGEYTHYLKAWSERNSRIKNSQLHVAISCKGQEKSKEELLGVAKQWLKEMGYDGIPALFVYHHDTDNNHLHIISSRVDKDGRKVNDSNERWRGRAILKRLEGMRLSLEDEAKKAIEDALSYCVSNKKQVCLVLESKKYKVAELENGDVVITKYGRQVGVITHDKINQAILEGERKEEDNGREKQLRAILSKYKDQMSLAELKDLMRRAFGVDLIFFGNADKPYGYAIIDHRDKCVYKGGEIMSLKDLLGEKKIKVDHKERVEQLISLVLEEGNPTSRGVNMMLKKYGYSLRKDTLYHYGKEIGKLSSIYLEQIKYNDKLDRTRKIKTDNPRILDAVSRHFNVNRDDLSISESRSMVTNMGYRSLQELYDKAYLSGETLYYLKLHNAFMFKDEGKIYLVEQSTGSIAEINTNNPERDLISEKQDVGEVPTPSIEIDDVINVFGATQGGASSVNNELPPKKKRRR